MAYDEHLADRVSQVLDRKNVLYEEKRMFGGLCFMVDEKMCIGIDEERMMARIGPDVYEESLKREGCTEMDFTGRPLKGFVYVDGDGFDRDEDLEYWVNLCLDYNPHAPKTKKKKKKE